MGQPAEQLRQATYAEIESLPEHQVGEILNGMLHVMPRPAPKHATACSQLGGELMGPFDRGRGGPGGWRILDEPELHFPNPAAQAGKDVVVPDLAGWLRERMPVLPTTVYFAMAPDWICEVLSESTEEVDREVKMPIYAREGVRYAWLIDPIKRTLEVYVLEGRRWGPASVWNGDERPRVAPFEAIELELSALWE
jgi:Uma2 family endonuclease